MASIKKLHFRLKIAFILAYFENRWVWNSQNWDSENLRVMDKKFEFSIENWKHVSIFLVLLIKMDTTLKIHNICNLKLHYFFKVWFQLGTHMYHQHSNYRICEIEEKICTGQSYLKPGLKFIGLKFSFSEKAIKFGQSAL